MSFSILSSFCNFFVIIFVFSLSFVCLRFFYFTFFLVPATQVAPVETDDDTKNTFYRWPSKTGGDWNQFPWGFDGDCCCET